MQATQTEDTLARLSGTGRRRGAPDWSTAGSGGAALQGARGRRSRLFHRRGCNRSAPLGVWLLRDRRRHWGYILDVGLILAFLTVSLLVLDSMRNSRQGRKRGNRPPKNFGVADLANR